MSQFSDPFSSAYGGPPSDFLEYIADDGPNQLYSPIPSGSQDTSLPSSEPRAAPDCLPRICPDRIRSFIVYSPEMGHEFVQWWLQTDFGKKKQISWDAKRAAQCWKNFDQVALEKDGKPGVMCQQCRKVLDHPGWAHSGTSSMNKHYNGINCRKAVSAAGKKPNIKLALEHAVCPRPDSDREQPNSDLDVQAQNATVRRFDERVWQQKLAKLLTVSHLPFLFLEHTEFRDLISYARLAPSMPEIPSAKVMRRQLRDLVRENQKSILQKLPSGAKLSLALDCWTSPFRQAFMAITGYFLDEDWEYHEILLGFEHLHGSHSGANLSEVLLQLLQEHQITDRVLAVTTDNASNNVTLMASVHEAIESLQSSNDVVIIRVPCIAHVIQLSLKDLLGKMKAAPKNDTAEQAWSDDRVDSLRARQQKREIVDTLNKVRHRDFISNLSFIILMCVS